MSPRVKLTARPRLSDCGNCEKVMFDADLAKLYGVSTKALNQAFRRNKQRFPADFVFQLSSTEYNDLKSQIVTSSLHGGRRRPPYAFTEQGVAMLSSVLRSGSGGRSEHCDHAHVRAVAP